MLGAMARLSPLRTARWAAPAALAGWLLWGAASALAADAPAAAATAAPAPITVDDYFAAPAMSRPLLSPSGKHLAVQLTLANGRRQLAVMDLEPPRKIRVVAGFSDADVDRVQWVNDERLVFGIDDLQSAWADRLSPGLFAVDRRGDEGEAVRMLILRERQFVQRLKPDLRVLPPNHRLLRVLRDGSDDVVVEGPGRDGSVLLRLNTRNGRHVVMGDFGVPEHARGWWLDSRGRARVARAVRGNQTRLFWREQPEGPWVLLATQATYGAGALQPLGLGADDRLYVSAPDRSDSDGTTALFRIDSATRAPEAQPLVVLKGFDFVGGPLFDGASGKLLGVRYLSDALGTVWFDAQAQAVQASIDKRLPGLVNLIDRAECGCSRWSMVTSFSDRQPQLYWLHDGQTDALEPIGRAQPRIDAQRMAERELTRIAARDGLGLPLHITRPAGKGPWPTVVLVHGGPYVRGGTWQWQADSQFLASRGYLVIEPEFRGSTGYGSRLYRAGWKQWGLKMQDDIADATHWAIAQRLAERGRICIAGGSYGGYATLMGLIRDPDLYRCGVAYVAVTDIGLLYSLDESDLSELWKEHGMPVLIGDAKADADQFAATSPLQQAARLKQPLLLAFGGQDKRVPLAHGTRLRDALAPTNAQVEWVVYPDEGHGFFLPANRRDFWTRVERFLGRHLGVPSAVSAPPGGPGPR